METLHHGRGIMFPIGGLSGLKSDNGYRLFYSTEVWPVFYQYQSILVKIEPFSQRPVVFN